MTAVDFRDRGYDDGYAAQNRQSHHDQVYDRGGWDDPARYATDADGDMRVTRAGAVGRVTLLLNYLGAIVSVGLMIGLMVWGYRLVTRDVSGVPVIRALVGEARVAPDDPGGELSDDRGLAVSAVPAGIGAGAAQPGRVAMAPAPAGLAADDVAMGQLGATSRVPGALAEVAPSADAPFVIAVTDAETRRLAAEQQAAVAAAAEAEAAAGAQAVAAIAALPETTDEPASDAPVDSAVTDLTGAPTQAAAIATALAEADAPAPVAAIRPQQRPQRLAVVADPAPTQSAIAAAPEAEAPAAGSTEPAAKPEAVVETAEAKPAAAASGRTVVQIGAFDSDKLARGEWERVAGRNGGLFSGKSQVVQKTERNGRTFWRLRVAGFGSRDEARAFCAELKAAGTDCIPTAAN